MQIQAHRHLPLHNSINNYRRVAVKSIAFFNIPRYPHMIPIKIEV